MPPRIKYNRPNDFGNGCVFAITNWKGFLGALDSEHAKVTGTINEVDTPRGTGIEVGTANSYVQFDWTGQAPLAASPRTIFALIFFPNVAISNYGFISWGNYIVIRDGIAFRLSVAPSYIVGYNLEFDAGGVPNNNTWFTFAWTNTGVNGGANLGYVEGNPVIAGTNAGNAVTSATDLFLFRLTTGGQQCPVGTIIQTILVFDRVLNAGDIQDLHNDIIALGTNP